MKTEEDRGGRREPGLHGFRSCRFLCGLVEAASPLCRVELGRDVIFGVFPPAVLWERHSPVHLSSHSCDVGLFGTYYTLLETETTAMNKTSQTPVHMGRSSQ